MPGIEGRWDSIIFQAAESLGEENLTFYPKADTGLGYSAQLGMLLWKVVFVF